MRSRAACSIATSSCRACVKPARVINSAPFGMMFIRGDFDIEGQPKPRLSAGKPKIDAGYFKTMGIPLLAGREFTT
jgi:hypothetical protein